MKALVTGGRGFIGSFLVEELLSRNTEVRCLLRKKGSGHDWLQNDRIERIEGDITNPESVKAAVENVDYVFHLAGATSAIDLEGYMQINAEGTKNLLSAVERYNPQLRKFIFVSSLAAAGPAPNQRKLRESDAAMPISNYGKSKLKAEEYVLAVKDKFHVSIIRPPAVFGPRETDIYSYFKLAQKGFVTLISGGPRFFSAVFVKDLVEGTLLASQKEYPSGELFYICNDEVYSWKEFGHLVASALNRKARTIKVPIFPVLLAAAVSHFGARLRRKPSIFNLDKYRELKQTHWTCDNQKARDMLGFEVKYAIDESLRETADWYKANGWL